MEESANMEDLAEQVAQTAKKAVEMCEMRSGHLMDYSESTLGVVEEMIVEASGYLEEMTLEQRDILTQDFGCYILEVARREFGGQYQWVSERDQPALVVGKTDCRVALMAWDKVRGRLSGDPSDNIPFFYAGFAERVRQAEPGTDAIYV